MKSPVKLVALAFLMSSACVFAADQPPMRTWTDSTGKYKIEARFEKVEKGVVFLTKKENNEKMQVPLAKLSEQDRTYIRNWLKPKKEEPAPKPVQAESKQSVGDAWKGTWNNNKYGTKGPLTCTVTAIEGKTWKAKFVGTGIGKPFTYDAAINSTEKGDRTILQGTYSISGDAYRWTGYVEGNLLYGKYRSASGNNGEFRLKAEG